MHPRPPEAYRDRQLTTNFEFWVEIFCVPTCFHVRIPNPCLSVRTPRKENHHSFVYISPTLVIDTSMERSLRVLHHGNSKIWIFFQKSSKFEFWLVLKSWNNLSFVNITPTLVIDTSMERSSRVLQHGNIKIWFKKNRNWILTFFLSSKLNFDLWNHSSRSQHAPIWRHRGCIVVPSRIDI